MRALQAQINPHFLFNTLNVLANLIHSNPAKAERVTEELADVFRYAL
jgi:sensor histidine kinase YesM